MMNHVFFRSMGVNAIVVLNEGHEQGTRVGGSK
jgi:hypothetical protein